MEVKEIFTFAVLSLRVPMIPICAFLQRAAERERECEKMMERKMLAVPLSQVVA